MWSLNCNLIFNFTLLISPTPITLKIRVSSTQKISLGTATFMSGTSVASELGDAVKILTPSCLRSLQHFVVYVFPVLTTFNHFIPLSHRSISCWIYDGTVFLDCAKIKLVGLAVAIYYFSFHCKVDFFSHMFRSSYFTVCLIELDDVCGYDKPSQCNIRVTLHGSPTDNFICYILISICSH